MFQPISITSIASISPLGHSMETIWKSYRDDRHRLTEKSFSYATALVSELPLYIKDELLTIRASDHKYKSLDDSVLFAIYASRKAIEQAGWSSHDNFGINIGSSRGATQLFEHHHTEFIKNNKSNTLSSPTTTLGNISSWVAHDLQTQGPEISHSITCSTALHALLNGIAWINSGMCDKFLVGGSEAPLTAFTVAQMQALKIYAQPLTKEEPKDQTFPCRALDLNKTKNTMVLGEAAAMACLEKGLRKAALAIITGIGYATEILEHNVSLSSDATCFQRSMTMALGTKNPSDVDIIVTHTPGTIKGDRSEYEAIKKIFCNKLPSLTTNKWKVGHSLGASGMMSVEMAILMLIHNQFIAVPYLETTQPQRIQNILVNAVGFGGNAVSILLSKGY